jgi:hypothetical protein
MVIWPTRIVIGGSWMLKVEPTPATLRLAPLSWSVPLLTVTVFDEVSIVADAPTAVPARFIVVDAVPSVVPLHAIVDVPAATVPAGMVTVTFDTAIVEAPVIVAGGMVIVASVKVTASVVSVELQGPNECVTVWAGIVTVVVNVPPLNAAFSAAVEHELANSAAIPPTASIAT